jgi:hypothetical protein
MQTLLAKMGHFIKVIKGDTFYNFIIKWWENKNSKFDEYKDDDIEELNQLLYQAVLDARDEREHRCGSPETTTAIERAINGEEVLFISHYYGIGKIPNSKDNCVRWENRKKGLSHALIFLTDDGKGHFIDSLKTVEAVLDVAAEQA